VALIPTVVQLLNLTPIHVITRFRVFQPGHARVGLHHGVDRLADALLVDVFDIDVQAIQRVDQCLTFGRQLALAQCFIHLTFAFHAGPRRVTAALVMALLMRILHGLKSDAAATVEGQVLTAIELGVLVMLIATTDQGQVTAGLNLAADVFHVGDFVALALAVAAEPALFLRGKISD